MSGKEPEVLTGLKLAIEKITKGWPARQCLPLSPYWVEQLCDIQFPSGEVGYTGVSVITPARKERMITLRVSSKGRVGFQTEIGTLEGSLTVVQTLHLPQDNLPVVLRYNELSHFRQGYGGEVFIPLASFERKIASPYKMRSFLELIKRAGEPAPLYYCPEDKVSGAKSLRQEILNSFDIEV